MTVQKSDAEPLRLDVGAIDRYLAGNADVAEKAHVERVLAMSEVHETLVQRLRSVSYIAEASEMSETIEIDIDTQWRRVQQRIAPQYTPVAPVVSPHSRTTFPTFRRVWPWMAMTVAIMVTGIGIGRLTTAGSSRQSLSSSLMTYSTGAGQQSSIELADGTRVLLNVGTRIRIPENFSSGHRTVYLDGEAYFQVKHSSRAPLTVDALGTRTTVLGTEFSVRAYAGAPVEVTVQSGKVAVNDTVLNANDIARVSVDHRIHVFRNQRVDAALGFVDGRLVLRDVALRDAIPDLNRWYDVDIRLSDHTIGSLPIHATLRGESIGELITVLRLTFGVDVVRHGRTLTLSHPLQ